MRLDLEGDVLSVADARNHADSHPAVATPIDPVCGMTVGPPCIQIDASHHLVIHSGDRLDARWSAGFPGHFADPPYSGLSLAEEDRDLGRFAVPALIFRSSEVDPLVASGNAHHACAIPTARKIIVAKSLQNYCGLGRKILLSALLLVLPDSVCAQMNMSPYFSTIDRPLEEHSLMLMALPDLQKARFGRNFATGMLMAEYGITPRWTAGVMFEGQKISGMPATYGGARVNTYVHLFRDDRFLNLTLYGEYEDLNGAALYKMEVAGFGPEDLTEPLADARRTSVRTFEQRAIVYHDWNRFSATFNFIRETPL